MTSDTIYNTLYKLNSGFKRKHRILSIDLIHRLPGAFAVEHFNFKCIKLRLSTYENLENSNRNVNYIMITIIINYLIHSNISRDCMSFCFVKTDD